MQTQKLTRLALASAISALLMTPAYAQMAGMPPPHPSKAMKGTMTLNGSFIMDGSAYPIQGAMNPIIYPSDLTKDRWVGLMRTPDGKAMMMGEGTSMDARLDKSLGIDHDKTPGGKKKMNMSEPINLSGVITMMGKTYRCTMTMTPQGK